MVSRCVAILIGTWFPMLALILPLGPTHTVNAIIAGVLATVLSLASLSDNRFRIATAAVGGWVALSPFLFSSTLLEADRQRDDDEGDKPQDSFHLILLRWSGRWPPGRVVRHRCRTPSLR